MNTKIQAKLLKELYRLLPQRCQLLIATHSIGMMREAFDLHKANPGEVAFLNFSDINFDERVVVEPAKINRKLWKEVFSIAIDDMVDLLIPKHIILCEGNMATPTSRRNTEFDAKIYRIVFGDSHPDTEFISLGGASEVANGELVMSTVLRQITRGISMSSLIDRDDRSEIEVEELRSKGTKVLKRRDLENYLWDDEILLKFCELCGKPESHANILAEKHKLLSEATENGKHHDDIKNITGGLYSFLKRELSITQRGNNKEAFSEGELAPLVTFETTVYKELEVEVFK
jgi:hypothetical protein